MRDEASKKEVPLPPRRKPTDRDRREEPDTTQKSNNKHQTNGRKSLFLVVWTLLSTPVGWFKRDKDHIQAQTTSDKES